MAAIPLLQIPCPACGDTVEVPVAAQLGDRSGRRVEMTLTADDIPVRGHIAQHTGEA